MFPHDRAPHSTAAPSATIAFVLPHLGMGGIEHVVLRLVNGLDRARFRPVLCLRRAEGALLAEVAPDVKVLDGGGRRAMLFAPALARMLRTNRVDLVYSGTNAANLASIAAVGLLSRARRPGLMISEHTSAAAYLDGAKAARLRRALVRALYPRADLLIAPMDSIALDWIGAAGLAGLNWAAAPNPVLEADWRPRADRPGQRQSGLVVAAGRLVPDKAFDLLIRAFAEVARTRGDARLTIFGEGPDRAELEALVQAEGLEGRVALPGLTDRLSEEFARASLAVLSSRREGFGNVVIEALAAGAPVVATDCAGPRALLQGLAQGEIVPVGDRAALAAAIAGRLARPVEPAAQVAAQARAGQYGVAQAVEVFSGLAERVLARGALPRADGRAALS